MISLQMAPARTTAAVGSFEDVNTALSSCLQRYTAVRREIGSYLYGIRNQANVNIVFYIGKSRDSSGNDDR